MYKWEYRLENVKVRISFRTQYARDSDLVFLEYAKATCIVYS